MRSRALLTLLAACLLPLAACMEQPLEPGDRDRVLTIAELQPYGLRLPPGFEAYETFTREHWFDGSVEIHYEFDPPPEWSAPYLSSSAETHTSRSDACLTLAAGRIGVRIGGGELVERNDLFAFGDKSTFALLVADGSPYGNYFGMCHGKTSLTVILGGFYFDDGEVWAHLLRPTLEALTPAP